MQGTVHPCQSLVPHGPQGSRDTIGICFVRQPNRGFAVDLTGNSSQSQWPFPLVISFTESGAKVMYTPRSDALLRVQDVPHMILELASNPEENDRYRMLLQAACLAR